ncbi:MAG: glycolate oxidase subunit GlcF [Pseudomonadota bacterium]
MQTDIPEATRNTAQGREAEAILRSCVHCGFCLATCPTYQLLGDELDSPRGRIYLIKRMLEGEAERATVRDHLDRCLTCRACESTCPSGVRYTRLAGIGREAAERSRGWIDKGARKILAVFLLTPWLLRSAYALGKALWPLLPAGTQRKIPRVGPARAWPQTRHARTMLLLDGCVQPVLVPAVNAAAARVLHRLGIALLRVDAAGCCGAIEHHLSQHERALHAMRRNIDAWWPHLEQGAEAILSTASGCGVQIREYGELLADDPCYAEKARRVSELARDISEVVAAEEAKLGDLLADKPVAAKARLAFHSPCTLQHGLRIRGVVERLLEACGHELVPVADGHLCCGSAGTYSMLQPALSRRLRDDKLAKLTAGQPRQIATANIGCQLHLQAGSALPVHHWIELLDEALSGDGKRRG